MPILEWKDVKQEGTFVMDTLGCWSIWAGMTKEGNYMRNTLLSHLNIGEDLRFLVLSFGALTHA